MHVAISLLNLLCLYEGRVTASQSRDGSFGLPLQVLSHKCKLFSEWILVSSVSHPWMCFGKDQRCIKQSWKWIIIRWINGWVFEIKISEIKCMFVSCSGYLRLTNKNKIFSYMLLRKVRSNYFQSVICCIYDYWGYWKCKVCSPTPFSTFSYWCIPDLTTHYAQS